MSTAIRRTVPAIALAGAMAMLATGCIAGENAGNTTDSAAATGEWSTDQLTLDWATYNPLSLVLRDQGLIEDALGDDVTVEWVQSTGSNTANELLRLVTARVDHVVQHHVIAGSGRIHLVVHLDLPGQVPFKFIRCRRPGIRIFPAHLHLQFNRTHECHLRPPGIPHRHASL